MATSNDVTLRIRSAAMRLRALARNGLAYTKDPFDVERFGTIAAIGQELADLVSGGAPQTVDPAVERVAGYTTPKVDVRAAVFRTDGSLLMVQEKDDGRWAIPGGWCDILETPSEAVAREVQEETGLEVEVIRLAALVDRERWDHQPPFDAHVYKLFFVCAPTSSAGPLATLDEREVSDVGWFSVDRLPPLSQSRLVPEQVHMVAARWADPALPTYFD
jgi:ADP-ribose pyrophosphatase YjhB (NUDIX family)